MSLVTDLAGQIRLAREELPVAQVAAAAERLRMAGGLLAWVMHSTGETARVPQLGAASERLDAAAGLMRAAQDALEAYTSALGVPADPVGDGPLLVAAIPNPRNGSQLNDWWAERVRELAGRDALDEVVTPAGNGKPSSMSTSDAAPSSTDLLQRLASAALNGLPARLHRELTNAGPAVGLGLAAVAPPLLRHLAAELVGHSPRLEDLARVRRAAMVHVGLLPNLPGEAAEEVVSRICHAAFQRNADRGPTHPVDAAAAAALLTAGLLSATQRDAADLTAVVSEEQRLRTPLAETTIKRAALRIGDPSRRRSAIDALGDAHVG
jgi:hypothetical protein